MTAPAGLLDRLLGAPISAARPTGLLTADDYAAARRQGLVGLGSGLLAASGGGPQFANLNQRLAAGINAGQQGYQAALDRAQATAVAQQGYDYNQLKMQGAKQDMARQQAIQQGRDQIIAANPMPDQTDTAALASWIDRVLPAFIRLGDTETLGKLSEIRKSIEPKKQTAQTVRDISGAALGLDPKKVYAVQVDDQGNMVGKPLEQGVSANTSASLSFRESMTPVQQARLEQGILTRFAGDTKDYVKAHEAWSQVEGVVKRAEAGAHSADDIIQLVDGISRLNNPGAVVRSSTVQMQLQKIGSLIQKAQMQYGQAAHGMWPKDVVQSIARAAHAIADEHEKQYRSLRDKSIKRGEKVGLPEEYMDTILPNTWEGFQPGSAYGIPQVPQRLPGETVNDYIARTRGAQ